MFETGTNITEWCDDGPDANAPSVLKRPGGGGGGGGDTKSKAQTVTGCGEEERLGLGSTHDS